MNNMFLSVKQQDVVDKFARNNFQGIAWWKMGTGKTRLGLALAEASPAIKCFIVAPRRAHYGWQEEIDKTNFILSYELISADKIPEDYEINPDLHFLIVDELYMFSNVSAKRTKKLRMLALQFKHFIGLSGTIMPTSNNETIYGQLFALGRQYMIARNLSQFRKDFRKNSLLSRTFYRGESIKQWENRPGANEEIYSLLGNFIDIYTPDYSHRNIKEAHLTTPLTTEQRRMIKEIRDNYSLQIAGTDEVIDYKYGIQLLHAVNYISNGYYPPLESGAPLEAIKSNKIDRLIHLVENILLEGEKVIIWCAYRNDVERICREFPPEKTIKFIGGEDFDVERWETGEVSIVVGTAANGASVNYFSHVQYAIYFSLPTKVVDWEQSKFRTERVNSQHDGAFYYYLFNQSPSFDKRIYSVLKNNQNIEQKFINDFLNYNEGD